MESSQLHEIQLMGRAAAGDRTAFAELFDRHSPVVLGVLVKMLRRPELAEEVLQETFLQVWRQAGRYRPDRATPRGWLLMMARSRAIDRLRSDRSRSEREERALQEGGAAVDREPTAAARLEEQERAGRLQVALATLPAEQRRPIELAFMEGLSHREVAERVAEPLGTIKSRIRLGMLKLRDALST